MRWLPAALLLCVACAEGRAVPTGPRGGNGAPRDAAEGGSDAADDDGASVALDAGSELDGGSAIDAHTPDAASVIDAAPGRDATPAADAGPAAATLSGSVFMSLSAYELGGTAIAITSLGAGFSELAAGTSCTEGAAGACAIYRCPGGGSTPRPVDGGEISATLNGRRYTSSFSSQTGYYSPHTEMSALWSGGETIDFASAGARVPSFSARLVAPSIAIVRSPALPAGGAALSLPGGDLPLAWSGGGGELVVYLSAGNVPGGGSVSVECVFLAAQGAGSVPAQAIAALPAGAQSYGFSALTRARTQLRAGDAEVYVQAQASAVTPAGEIASRALAR